MFLGQFVKHTDSRMLSETYEVMLTAAGGSMKQMVFFMEDCWSMWLS